MSKQRQAKVTPFNNPDLFYLATRMDVDNPAIREFYDASGCRWRRNGALKLWKTRPTEFQQPVKYGLYGYGYFTHNDLGQMWVKL